MHGHRIPIKLKQKFYKIHVSLATLYGPEYWSSTKLQNNMFINERMKWISVYTRKIGHDGICLKIEWLLLMRKEEGVA